MILQMIDDNVMMNLIDRSCQFSHDGWLLGVPSIEQCTIVESSRDIMLLYFDED
jgi:hypothetical protein